MPNRRKAELNRHERSCEGKKRHHTREAAFSALMSLVRNRGAVANQNTTYLCSACGFWHVGHQTYPGRRRG